MGYQKPYVKAVQTRQWAKDKGQTLWRKLNIERNPLLPFKINVHVTNTNCMRKGGGVLYIAYQANR